ncbi:hypothetical protein SAMD00079811_10490 [Scytonema sp. HK-05]|uniref:hypothetical protein n=1 Tax=Scytonema sp. HK-05 TaxID=1137095 RepID=UPI0009368159|nr:hypothetical protein [Scytonema sp. HK-05]OKH58788.1 hypothetical protein NIES2130_13015 [Scytonema sp. HK-05]BAY43469.1 hypothetical protein SAMD00079811_10490 [Scytonema sp. HK-05]
MPEQSPGSKYSFTNSEVVQIIEKNDGTVIGKSVSEQKQNLAQARKEIQELCNQLNQNYPATTETQKQTAIIQTVQQQIKRNPTLRQRLWSAFTAGSTEALKQALDAIYKNPLVSISVETIKGFLEAEYSE